MKYFSLQEHINQINGAYYVVDKPILGKDFMMLWKHCNYVRNGRGFVIKTIVLYNLNYYWHKMKAMIVTLKSLCKR